MFEHPACLVSNFLYNFRDKEGENPIIIGVVYAAKVSPTYNRELHPCYKVAYKDGFVNLVPIKEVEEGLWTIQIIQ